MSDEYFVLDFFFKGFELIQTNDFRNSNLTKCILYSFMFCLNLFWYGLKSINGNLNCMVSDNPFLFENIMRTGGKRRSKETRSFGDFIPFIHITIYFELLCNFPSYAADLLFQIYFNFFFVNQI